ncbi:Hypothetical predicted protein, partial [Mytilus galloprovincialis]
MLTSQHEKSNACKAGLTGAYKQNSEGLKISEVSVNDPYGPTVAASLILKVKINGVDVDAVVDTAAQVTIISEKFMKKLQPPLELKSSVTLKGAGAENKIKARYANRVSIRTGKTETKWQIIVADITDPVLLGLDFLQHLQAVIDLANYTVKINNQTLQASAVKSNNKEMKVCRVTLNQNVVIPSMTVIEFSAMLEGKVNSDICIQPNQNLVGIMMPYIVTTPNKTVPITIRNLTDKNISLRKGTNLGTAVEIDEVLENQNPEQNSITARQISRDGNHSEKTEEVCQNMPENLKDLFERSKENLNEKESIQLAQLLIKYKNTFSINDLDIGHFTKIKHRIDTGTSTPAKERMRRTPLGFEAEEEKHLGELLKRKIIQKSSEWCAAPVLVRKRDGKIRYCIDYRKLNFKTRKDCFPLPRIESCIDTLRGTEFMSCLDMSSGYYQFEIHEDDRHKTAFVTKYGLFEHIRLSFGLCNSPAFFSESHSANSVRTDVERMLSIPFLSHLYNLEKVLQLCYSSKVRTPIQKRYCTTRKELLAVVTFTRQFRNYLLGRQFTVRTDHHSLIWLLRFKNIEGQLARWLEELSQYDMVIQHRPGKKHQNADGLSRIPDDLEPCNCYHAGADLLSLPCKGCAYCSRAQRTWGKFENDVDDVVPLAVRSIQHHPQDEISVQEKNWPDGRRKNHDLSQLFKDDNDGEPDLFVQETEEGINKDYDGSTGLESFQQLQDLESFIDITEEIQETGVEQHSTGLKTRYSSDVDLGDRHIVTNLDGINVFLNNDSTDNLDATFFMAKSWNDGKEMEEVHRQYYEDLDYDEDVDEGKEDTQQEKEQEE